ncbi:helix-turn-helix transcriptional regulator [Actinocatenispora rupis]|uniref:Transcriptional regulator n=1 Tax=Actinocatenispora rupis TaxID=519421 RepID=A0A8J3J9Y1_9ACTN|nr:WYL domain-containing protein [Actinocatenispora rupis]GID12133.1 transcriptional regulator [Actinocatenispora rupis]
MRASRLLSLLLYLQVRGRVSGRELAARLEVSERTVQRDMEALAAAGVPVRSVRGPAGGYTLPGGYRTRLTGLGVDEAQALAFLGLSGPADELGLTGQLDTAQRKLWAALSGEARDRAERSAQRFHLDPVRWYGTAEPTPQLATLAEAVWTDRRVRIRYTSRARTTERVLDPLGLVLAAGDWYLVALRDGARRTYRISRVTVAQVLVEPARRPAGFDLAAEWRAARVELENSHTLMEVTVRAEVDVLPRLRRLVAVSGQDRIDLTATGPVEVTVPFEGVRWARSALLGLGAGVEVLAPPEVRDWIAAESRATAARYA